ncbi:MAG: NAD(P)/FAD-dependent oxidoreductase [Acholeplasmataceae bacterium]|jgi:glycerol-3-phosphate dehydrogenase|nr:NAD(P)/FAD-dependent oxidoreductase [Acholeplasmataceae bacterium]
MYDYIIIGSGIIGSLIARELSRYEVTVLVVDKENDIASHQTTANSAIIHSGHDPKVGSLKAKLCVEGNKLYDELEEELSIPLLRTGAFVVVHGKDEEYALDELYQRAIQNGVSELKMLSGDEVRYEEPLLNDSITKALSLPTTKVTYPWEVAIAAMSNAIKNGVEFRRNSEVIHLEKEKDIFTVTLSNHEKLYAKNIINAAGVMSDQIAHMLENDIPFKITPRRGEYLVLDRKAKGLFSHVIYPLPTKRGKGVLIVPQVHGNILLGPSSENQMSTHQATTTYQGLTYIKDSIMKMTSHIPYGLIIRTFAGIRATSTYDDFYIKESTHYSHFYHVAGIDSPGLTAAPAIAKYLIHDILGITSPLKTNFDPRRKKPIVFYDLPEQERPEMIKNNPKYGNIICKCEKITEQEIIDAIHGPTGNDTVKGIKKRARAGSGLCQGGYCEGLVLKIIAREKGMKLSDVNYYHENTQILKKETKAHD